MSETFESSEEIRKNLLLMADRGPTEFMAALTCRLLMEILAELKRKP